MKTIKKPEKLYVIHHSNKWGVFNFARTRRSMKNFKYRELAFHFAATIAKQVNVHNVDGSIEFIFFNKE